MDPDVEDDAPADMTMDPPVPDPETDPAEMDTDPPDPPTAVPPYRDRVPPLEEA